MGQNKPGGIVALDAQTQHLLGEALRPAEFTAVQVIATLPIGNLKELRGGRQLLPQLSCAVIGLARFSRGEAFDSVQHCSQSTPKFELLALAFGSSDSSAN